MQNLSLYVLSLLTIIPHPISTFQLGSRYLACYIINMHRNCLKNSCRSGSASPTNPAPLLLAFANLLTKDHIKYGVTGSVRVRVSINIKLSVLHLIHSYIYVRQMALQNCLTVVLHDRHENSLGARIHYSHDGHVHTTVVPDYSHDTRPSGEQPIRIVTHDWSREQHPPLSYQIIRFIAIYGSILLLSGLLTFEIPQPITSWMCILLGNTVILFYRKGPHRTAKDLYKFRKGLWQNNKGPTGRSVRTTKNCKFTEFVLTCGLT